MLEASEIFTFAPISYGGATLEAAATPRATLVAPFKGQAMAVADALRADIAMVLPPAGQCGESAKARAYWRAPGQWLVFGPVDAAKLEGMAATADMSDAFARLRLSGPAMFDVLARLVPVDVFAMAQGQVAHTDMADIPVTLIRKADATELVLPRSFAQSARARAETAMKSLAAQAALG